MIGGITKRGKNIHDEVNPEQLYHSKDGIANKLGNNRDDACSNVDRELELIIISIALIYLTHDKSYLAELLDRIVDCSSPAQSLDN